MEKEMLNCRAKPGDVVAFSGRGLESDGINLATFGLPRWGISHVGIVTGELSQHPRICDSTRERGVELNDLWETVREYEGRVWLFPLVRLLFYHEEMRLLLQLRKFENRSYDMKGALRSGGRLWSWIQSVARGEDLTSLFCSELVAEALSNIGVFHTANASRWSPNHLVRKLRRLGIVEKPRRLK